jgi:tetratricopeptide (TPR) repeat protein
VAVRDVSSPAEALFDSAMSAYVTEDFRGAAEGLREALDAGSHPVPTQLLLGSSRLMVGRPQEAAEALESVIEAGASPYLAEAHYYLAKAYLRLAEGERAVAELRASVSLQGEISPRARTLADSVEVHMGG